MIGIKKNIFVRLSSIYFIYLVLDVDVFYFSKYVIFSIIVVIGVIV